MNDLARRILEDHNQGSALWNYLIETFHDIKHKDSTDTILPPPPQIDDIKEFLEFVNQISNCMIQIQNNLKLDDPEEYEYHNSKEFNYRQEIEKHTI